jgi:hypothetical protein
MSRTRKVATESPSKKLRNVFFRLWEQDNEGNEEFETYYESKLYKLINHYKKLIK